MIFIHIFSIRKVSFTDFILVFSLIAVGGFNEWISAVISVALLAYLIYKCVEQKKLKLNKDLLFIPVTIICISYFATSFWAIDVGMAIVGGIKYLPLILFLIAIKQEDQDKNNTYQILTLTTAAMVVVSTICSLIPQVSRYFTVAGRLAGFFQYPNTFAMLILLCELLILQKKKFVVLDVIYLAIFIFGIIYSGSRIVFVLFLISNVVILLLKPNKKFRIGFLLSIATLLLLILLFFNDNAVVQRFLRISIFESTFVGRILYWVDALPLLIKYPFGMGYLGYDYIHPTIQSGIYSVQFIHNDFLQLLLDIGWLPVIAFVFVICKKIFSTNTDKNLKIILLVFSAHIFLDFDLQFISMFLIFILFLEDSNSKTVTVKSNNIISLVLAVLLAVNTYMSIHLVLANFRLEKQADRLYPWNTEVHIALLEKEQSISKANELANVIIAQNNTTYIPYVIKAKYAYANGDFNAVITHNRELLSRAPMLYDNYENYAWMLMEGARAYQAINDYESARFCTQELIRVKTELEKIPSKLSVLGKSIKDQPKTELSGEILEFIDGLEE